MFEIKITHKGVNYSGVLSHVSGAGNNQSYHLMIENRYFGQLFKTGTWRYGGFFDDIAEDISKFMEQVENAKEKLIPEALGEISRERNPKNIDHAYLDSWWNDHWWIFYPVDRSDMIQAIGGTQNPTVFSSRPSGVFPIEFEVRLNTLPEWN